METQPDKSRARERAQPLRMAAVRRTSLSRGSSDRTSIGHLARAAVTRFRHLEIKTAKQHTYSAG